MTNPYQPPEAPPYAGASAPRPGVDLERLRKIATYQRFINLAILADFAAMGALGALQLPAGLEQLIRIVVFAAVGIASLIAEFLLVNTLHGTLVAVLCAPLMFIPCVNLLVLLVFNQQATSRLREAGFKVGLLGANPDDIK
jgi:hypothetical protein